MALEYQVFKPVKCESEESWKAELETQRERLATLDKAGAEGRDELQLFLADLAWAVVRGDLTAMRGSELLAGTAVATKEPLQRAFADVLWMVGFASTEAPANRELREEFNMFLALLEQKRVLPPRLMALSLETEVVPPAVCAVALLRKKHNQAKTKARYTITRFNLMRENSEGYARLVCLLERLASCEFAPAASPEQQAATEQVFADDVIRLIGFGHLCPNRTVAMALDVYESRLLERGDSLLLKPLLTLLRRFPSKRLTEVAVFMLLAHPPAPAAGKPPPAVEAPSRPSQLLAVASLIQAGLVDLDVLWSYLDPADAALRKEHEDLMVRYGDEVASIGKVDLGGNGTTKDRVTFDRSLQNFSQLGHQKLRLAAALLSVNCWSRACRVLQHLQTLCKPCLHHGVRSALCDLLKWILWPYLQKGETATTARPEATVESTFAGVRRFGAGLEALAAATADGTLPTGNGHAAAPLALEPSEDFETLLPRVRLVLEHLEYFLHTDLHLLTMLWRMVLKYCKEHATKEGGKVVLDDGMVGLLYKHLLPAACMVPNNPFLSDLMWSVVKQLSVYQRYLIYSCWETVYDSFMLKLVAARTRTATKQILKRVVSNADKRDLVAHQSHFHICKLCHSNPIPCLEIMLRDMEIGFNVNMIQPYVECTNRCPDMTADIMGYLLARTCAKPAGPDRVFLSQADATYGPWLLNLGEFCGRFFKKHPQTDLIGLLTIITKRLNGESEAKAAVPGMPQEYKGESLIRLVLESLIEQMGGLLTVADLTAEQLVCLAGGPRLRQESVSMGSTGKKEDSVRKERARHALLAAFTEQQLVPILWYSLSQQRHHFLSEEFAENHGNSGGLKLLSLLFDGNHQCFLQLTEFLAQACSRERYAALMPPVQEVFAMFEPNLAFLAMRHGLPSYGRGLARAMASQAQGEGAKGPLQIQEPPAFAELERVVRRFLPSKAEEEGLSMSFYLTFWRLSLQDIFTPTEGYERAEISIQGEIKQLEKTKRDLERQHNQDKKRDVKAIGKEILRLQDQIVKLKEERVHHSLNHKQVQARLEQEKAGWFLRPSPSATAAFVADMICPRVLTSYADALFCCYFVRMLIKLKTPGFQLLDFYNSWTIMLTQCIRCCSEREAQIFGVFLRDMMSYVLRLRDDEERYNLERKDNPCFHRNYYEDPKATVVEWAQFSDIKKGHSKWEGRIYKALRAGLDSDEWMERRNTLLLLSQSFEAFPLVEKYAKPILNAVDAFKDKEEFADLKTLAGAVALKLKTQKDRWVDKVEPKPDPKGDGKEEGKDDAKAEKGEGKSDAKAEGRDGKDDKRRSAKADRDEGNGAAPSGSRDRDRARARDGSREKEAPAEKRSRRDADDGHKERSSKDAKEPKERDGDRKRQRAGSADRAAAGHEERDKRRRGEREEPAGRERHARSALDAPLDAGHRGDYSRRGGYSGGASSRHGDRRR